MSREKSDRSEAAHFEIARLEAEIRRHRELYYNEQPEISDPEFDALVDELERLAPRSPVLAEVGAPASEGNLPKKKHRIPMGSLEKIPEEKLEAWAEKTGPVFLVQEKYDGISLEVEYEDGKMVDAITRGDGFTGEVVTHNATSFRNLPAELPGGFTGSLRGEVILRLSMFREKFAKEGFANPRNTVSGLVRKKHGDRSLGEHFEVLFYDVVTEARDFATEKEKMHFIRDDLGAALAVSYFDEDFEGVRSLWREYVGAASEEDVEEEAEHGETPDGKRQELDYEIDGLVVRADSLALQKKLGSRRNRPRFAMAYKFPSEGQATILRAVDWTVGIGSRVTPVARLEPVEVAGVTVSNAGLHNVDQVAELGLRLGDTVWVERRGDVIPQVMRVLSSAGGEVPQPPKDCPVCERELVRDGKFLLCPHGDCPAKAYGDLMRWVQAMEIDALGEKWIQILLDEGLVKTPADLYSLTIERLTPLERMGETLASRMVQNIQATRRPELDRFISGLNIPSFSRSRVQMLIQAGILELEELRALEAETIAEFPGFAEIMAENIVKGLEDRREGIDELLRAGVRPLKAVPPPEPSGPLAGKVFCFTGAVKTVNEETGKAWTRKQLQELVTDRGGEASTDVSKRTHYLVLANPDSTSSKAKKARKLGTEIVSEANFFAMIESAAEDDVVEAESENSR